ncbi:MAG TPA: methyltransferase domain-containing protein [Acidimicrobiia bacterium]|nr:methyltransferase domain-containing protein [Acidimicrobiia bacterium]
MDRSLVRVFMDRFEGLASGAAAIGALAVADRAGVLEAMAGRGSVTVAELAADRFAPRYVEEILAVLAAAGIVEHDASTGRFRLPDEHAACLADPDSPYSMAGWLDLLPAAMKAIDRISHATIHGGGVPIDEFDARAVAGVDRLNSPGTRVLLTKRWLPAMPDVVARLEAGARVADVGCGSGAAALAMASAYPMSTVTGFDVDPRAVARARDRAARSGLANLFVELMPVAELPTGFDLITTFDVIHDLPHPLEVLERIRAGLIAGGTYLMMEPAAEPALEDNFTPHGILTFASSLLYCLPQSLVDGGVGLGAGWGPVRAEQLCRQVGFTRFEVLPIDNPYSNFYRVEG